ncbi:hypothetical protein E2N92_00520 [Methanofollis formosanus]|uniref:Ferric reductase-like transmembrane domain-containing protein n=1 Tax=Methanofollis formosanus TaxID=299308 RepID=A0A8G1EFM3_9EURY|nr:hypothetical protein [Methanofollis formosanus]QYZ78017.1 hypothetical protein E2N92_00520 [Methanofollis formosanus]
MRWPGVALAGGITALFLIVSLRAVMQGGPPLGLAIRLVALNGVLALSIAAAMTPFLAGIRAVFGRPFLAVHHLFAAVGLVAALLHPALVAIGAGDLSVLVPSFASWTLFWTYGGRVALILILVALAAVFLRRRYPTSWRPFHMLMYAALFLIVVHANLIGTDLGDPVVRVVVNGAFVVVVGAFVVKRWRRRKVRKK